LVAASLSQDTAYDGSALWLDLCAGVGGRADRADRVMSLLTWAVPAQMIAVPVILAATHRWSLWPIVVGTTVGAMLAGTGVSWVVSARWLSPAPAAGGNAFSSSGGSARSGRGGFGGRRSRRCRSPSDFGRGLTSVRASAS